MSGKFPQCKIDKGFYSILWITVFGGGHLVMHLCAKKNPKPFHNTELNTHSIKTDLQVLMLLVIRREVVSPDTMKRIVWN